MMVMSESHLPFLAVFKRRVTLLYNSCIQNNVTFITAVGKGFFLQQDLQ